LCCLFIYWFDADYLCRSINDVEVLERCGGDDERWEDGECSIPFLLLCGYIMLTVTSGIQGWGAVHMVESLERGSNVTIHAYTASLQNAADRIGQSRIQGTES
jgi:hypothetical protein